MLGIKVIKLFGIFDYDIEMCRDSMTILTGPNGFGKSTLIKCIKAVSDSDLLFFLELQFEEIMLWFENKENHITIRRTEKGLNIDGKEIDADDYYHARRLAIRRSRYKAIDGEEFRYQEIMEQMHNIVGQVEYIEEQRLVSVGKDDSSYESRNRVLKQTVVEIPGKMKEKIEGVSLLYSGVANELDSTFPFRLFQEKNGIGQNEFDEKIFSMQKKVEKLDQYGISDIRNIQQMGEIRFQQEDARALKVYFEDFDKKYKQYSDLIEKMDLYKQMVNDRFRFKKMYISSEYGIQVKDDHGRKIELSKLSSGEKETLVLFYRLLFEVNDNALLLIDEPEISLHIAWQRKFAEDLEKIVKIKKLNAVVATHSPQVINGNYDIQIDLGELYTNGLH